MPVKIGKILSHKKKTGFAFCNACGRPTNSYQEISTDGPEPNTTYFRWICESCFKDIYWQQQVNSGEINVANLRDLFLRDMEDRLGPLEKRVSKLEAVLAAALEAAR
jgi:hypothetical protein